MIAILGDGILGSELAAQTGWNNISRAKDGFDITDNSTWDNLLIGFNCIINCIAYTDTYSHDFDLNWKVNVQGVKNLIDYCNHNNIKIVHISTDHIYSNSKPCASEKDVPVHLCTWYGYSKLIGDALVQLESKNYLICRESHKPFPFPYQKAWSDQFTNGDYVTTISGLIIKLILSGASGVYNVGTDIKTWADLTGSEPISKPEYTPDDITMDITKMNEFLKSKSHTVKD
jgi:hypothetical protein